MDINTWDMLDQLFHTEYSSLPLIIPLISASMDRANIDSSNNL